ncbi:hypothetical protein ACMFMG_004749 [Clarireedia jacksonii]
MTDEEYSKYHASAMEIMTGPMAKQAGITYLEEGTHTFTLKSGSSFNVYASPYTVGSGGWAFPYKSNEDRFNAPNQTAANKISVSENPIPLGVHIVMTHGPPYSILDQVDGQNLGCPNLLRAISRVRPMMHCFGHIHEGHGANIVTWMPDGTAKDPSAATPMETEQINEQTNSHGQRCDYAKHSKRDAARLQAFHSITRSAVPMTVMGGLSPADTHPTGSPSSQPLDI